jgi:hypothetical protein
MNPPKGVTEGLPRTEQRAYAAPRNATANIVRPWRQARRATFLQQSVRGALPLAPASLVVCLESGRALGRRLSSKSPDAVSDFPDAKNSLLRTPARRLPDGRLHRRPVASHPVTPNHVAGDKFFARARYNVLDGQLIAKNYTDQSVERYQLGGGWVRDTERVGEARVGESEVRRLPATDIRNGSKGS